MKFQNIIIVIIDYENINHTKDSFGSLSIFTFLTRGNNSSSMSAFLFTSLSSAIKSCVAKRACVKE